MERNIGNVRFVRVKDVGTKLKNEQLYDKILRVADDFVGQKLRPRTQYWFVWDQNVTEFQIKGSFERLAPDIPHKGHCISRLYSKKPGKNICRLTHAQHPQIEFFIFVEAEEKPHPADDVEVPNNVNIYDDYNRSSPVNPQDETANWNNPSTTSTPNMNQNTAQTESAKERVNLLLLVPPHNEILQLIHNTLTSMEFQQEVVSNDQCLYSRRQHIDWFVLLFPFSEERATYLAQYLLLASEAVLCLFDSQQQLDLVVINQILHESEHLQLLTQQKHLISSHLLKMTINFWEMALSVQSTISVIENAFRQMTSQFKPLAVGALQAKYPVEQPAALHSYLNAWLSTPTFTTMNVYVCFRYEKSVSTPFSQVQQNIYQAVKSIGIPVESFQVECIVQGSLLAYISCPSSTLWHVMAVQDKLFTVFQSHSMELTSIYEATVSDVEQSMAREDNAPYKAQLMELKQMMIREGAKQDPDNRQIYYSNTLSPEQRKAIALFDQGKEKFEEGNYKEALEAFTKANDLYTNNAQILKYHGATNFMLNNYQEALKELHKANLLQPNNPFTLSYRGATRWQLDDYEDALADLNAANDLQPNNAFTLKQCALAKISLFDPIGALEDITQAIKLNPTDKECVAWKNRIVVLKDSMNGNELIEASELTMVHTIGEGGYSQVFLAEWHGIKVAVKKAILQAQIRKVLVHEGKILRSLQHNHIVKSGGVTTDHMTIMEYMKEGTLNDLLAKTKLSHPETIQLALDIAKALTYLHSLTPKVIHRDLKDASIMLYGGRKHAKLAGFWHAVAMDNNEKRKTVLGTIGFIAPEMLAEEEYDEKVDIYSFGAVLYKMSSNNMLPILEEHARLIRIQQNVKDPELSQLVQDCCLSDPDKRPSAAQLVQVLKKMKKATKL